MARPNHCCPRWSLARSYLTAELDYTSKLETTIKESNRCHYFLYSNLAQSTQQATPTQCKPNLEEFSRTDLLWTHINQKFGLTNNNSLSVRYQQQLFTIRVPPGLDPIPFLITMLDLQRKINGNSASGDVQVVSDASISAAMLTALSDADWG